MARRGRGPPVDYTGADVLRPVHHHAPPPSAYLPQEDRGQRFPGGGVKNRQQQDQWRPPPDHDRRVGVGPMPQQVHNQRRELDEFDSQKPVDPRRRGPGGPMPPAPQHPAPPHPGHDRAPVYQSQGDPRSTHAVQRGRREGPHGQPPKMGPRQQQPPPTYQRGPPPQQQQHQQQARPFYPPPPPTPAPNSNTRGGPPPGPLPPNQGRGGDGWTGDRPRGPLPSPHHHQMSPPPSSVPRTGESQLIGQKRPYSSQSQGPMPHEQWRGGPRPPMPPAPVSLPGRGGGDSGRDAPTANRGSGEDHGNMAARPRPQQQHGDREGGRGGGSVGALRGKRGRRGAGGRINQRDVDGIEEGKRQGRGSPSGRGVRGGRQGDQGRERVGRGGERGRGGRGETRHGVPLKEGSGPAFRDVVRAVADAIDPQIMSAPQRYSVDQIAGCVTRLPVEVCRLRPEWEIRPEEIVAIGHDILARSGGAWDVLQEPVTSRPPARAPSPTIKQEDKVKVMVPHVRAVYSDHFFGNLHDATFPPWVKSNLDYSFAPLDFPLLRGLSAELYSRVKQEGMARFLQGSQDVRLNSAGEVEVAVDLLRLLYRLLFVGEVSVSCPSSSQASIVNSVNMLVKEAGRELATRDSKSYVHSLKHGCPLDVVSYFRKDILKRLESIVVEVEGANAAGVDVVMLGDVLALLSTPRYNLWDARRAEELTRLRTRVAAVSPANAPAAAAPPAHSLPPSSDALPPGAIGTPPHVYQKLSLQISPGHGLSVLDMPVDILRSPKVSPPPSPRSLQQQQGGLREGRGEAGGAAPKDPRRAFLKAAADKAVKVAPERVVKKLMFIEPAEKGDPEHKTYVKSHQYEGLEFGMSPLPCSNPKCKTTDWPRRCFRCGRCDACSKKIFCKGAEKVVTGEATGRLGDRMDHAIWLGFRERDFEPVLALVKYAKVNVNFRRASKGETALMAAAYTGNMAVCQELLSRGADPLLKTEDGLTAWVFATKYQHNAIADLIQDYISGAKKPIIAPTVLDDMPSPLEPMTLSPSPSVSEGVKDMEVSDSEEAPLAEGLVLMSRDGPPHGAHYEDGPSYSVNDAIGWGEEREPDIEDGPKQKRRKV